MSRKKRNITLFELLANNATADSRKLLKRHGQPDAKNYDDLELKLANFYHQHPDKVQLEKEFVEIHPHKDFILKYSAPKEQPKNEPKQYIVSESTTGADSSQQHTNECTCEKCSSNACGCKSNFDGNNDGAIVQKPSFINNELAVLGLLGIVAIVGMVVYSQKK